MTGIKNLVNGYTDFFKKISLESPELFKKISKGQKPKTLIIGCIDSRADPAIITNSKLGEIMVVRNVANIVPKSKKSKDGDSTISAIQFAVRCVKVKNIIILGHTGCAGVGRLLSPGKAYYWDWITNRTESLNFLKQWLNEAKDVRKNIGVNQEQLITLKGDKYTEILNTAVKENIINSINNLMSYSWINKAVKQKKISIYGWYFAVESGSLFQYDGKKKNFSSKVIRSLSL